MWVARFEDGSLYVFNKKPIRVYDNEIGYNGWIPDYYSVSYKDATPYTRQLYGSYFMISKELFPELKWEDEPIEVELKVK